MDLLKSESFALEAERQALVSLDVEYLVDRAERRAEFQDELLRLAHQVAGQAGKDPRALREMRDHAIAVQQAQHDNATLLERALRVVSSTLRVLVPQPLTYGRKGGLSQNALAGSRVTVKG